MPSHGGITEALAGLGSLELRVLASTALVILALLVGRYAVPVAMRVSHVALSERVVRGRLDAAVAFVEEYVPWRRSGRVIVRCGQLAVFALTGLSILVIWGQFEAAVAALSLLSGGAPIIWNVVVTALLLGGAYVGIQVLEDAVSDFVEQSNRLTQHQEEIAFRVLELVVIASAGVVTLSIWGVDLGGLLIGAGFLGIVVGMAARQTLGSLIAGFVLMFSRPFEVGDWVQIGDEEGRITDITIVNTRLENPDGELVSLPNDMVANRAIVNRTKKGRLRLRVDVGVDYDASPERAKEVALETMKDLDMLMRVPQPQAVARRFGDSAVVIELRFWIDNPSPRRRARATDAVIEAVKDALDREGIKIPFPQRELAGREEAGGFRLAGEEPPMESDAVAEDD